MRSVEMSPAGGGLGGGYPSHKTATSVCRQAGGIGAAFFKEINRYTGSHKIK